jgi:tripartite ATP-independent transporter DctM subunit
MIDWIGDHLAIIMFLVLTFIMFIGYPVAFVLGAIGIIFGYLGVLFGTYNIVQFANLLPRIYGGAVENQVLVAVPMFIFMGTVLERSGVAEELLKCLQVLLRRIPGGLALSVVLLGTIMAATTGIVGASVVMLTLIALPVMLERGYSKELSCGVIAASGTLGILIPPSIMLVIMGDLMQISVGLLFAAAILPGLIMSGTYLVYIMILAFLKPRLAPPLGALEGPQNASELMRMVLVTFAPPAFLIVLVLGSIFGGWATPTEAGGVGCFGALLLAARAGKLNYRTMKEMVENSAMTCGLVFFILFGATLFSYVFRALGGDDVVIEVLKYFGIDTGWETLIFVMAMAFFMGFFFDFLEICLILLPVFTPILAKATFPGFVEDPKLITLWFAVLLAVNLQTAFLTPPFGFALFYMKGSVPPSINMGHIYRGIIPFITLQLMALAICIYFPETVFWLPRRWGMLD